MSETAFTDEQLDGLEQYGQRYAEKQGWEYQGIDHVSSTKLYLQFCGGYQGDHTQFVLEVTKDPDGWYPSDLPDDDRSATVEKSRLGGVYAEGLDRAEEEFSNFFAEVPLSLVVDCLEESLAQFEPPELEPLYEDEQTAVYRTRATHDQLVVPIARYTEEAEESERVKKLAGDLRGVVQYIHNETARDLVPEVESEDHPEWYVHYDLSGRRYAE